MRIAKFLKKKVSNRGELLEKIVVSN